MKKIMVLCVMFLVFGMTNIATAEQIDFCGLNPGDPIEGLGAVHELLNIESSSGEGRIICEGITPGRYIAPNDNPLVNGCTKCGPSEPDDGPLQCGFSEMGDEAPHDFKFTFKDGVTISSFSLHMLDYGDVNPYGATEHSVKLVAFDSSGVEVDSEKFSYTSDDARNPRSGSAGDLWYTGDACTAKPGQPGNFAFNLSGADIALVKLIYKHNGNDYQEGASDPNIGFDNLNITFSRPCEEDDSGNLDIVAKKGSPGGPVTIPVRVQNAPNNVSAFGFEVTFPPPLLKFIGFDRGSLVADFAQIDCSEPGPGTIRCGGYTSTGEIPTGASGEVVRLHFEIDPGFTRAVQLDLQELKDHIANWSTSHGCVGFRCSCDVNGNGDVTPGDALCCFQKYMEICPTNCGPCDNVCCDVNGDEDVTPADALEIFKEYLGMESVCTSSTLKVDQVNEVDTRTSHGCGIPGFGLFQGFTPSVSPLAAVELGLRAGGSFPSEGVTTTINIRSDTADGILLGSATALVSGPQAARSARFRFSPSISLTPGEIYVIEWITTHGSVLTWMGATYDSYPGGSAYGCTGNVNPGQDLIFKTYTLGP